MNTAKTQFYLPEAKESAFLLRAQDEANYIGPIDLDEIQKSYEASFERFAVKNGKVVDFEEFIAKCDNLITDIMTAHPTFFKSGQESGLLAELFTAYAMENFEEAAKLEKQIQPTQAQHPYKDPTTDEEGELLYTSLRHTIEPEQMMQRAMIKVAQRNYPDQWKNGHYSPFNRAIWQKFDRDGRKIPVNVQLGEALRQRRLGLEYIYIPQIESLKKLEISSEQKVALNSSVERMRMTARLYKEAEDEFASLDENNIDMDKLQGILDKLIETKELRVTHPDQIKQSLIPILETDDIADEAFIAAKMIHDNLESNGLCFSTPTHRANAEDGFKYLETERRKIGKGDIRNRDNILADNKHFSSTEEIIAKASDQVVGSYTDMLKKIPADGGPVHEMMLNRRFVLDYIDGHTIEKVDIAEAHNATIQRAMRLAAKQYGVSERTDIGILHEDHLGIDNAEAIYTKLLKSEQYISEITHTVPGTSKNRARLVLKIGYSDFAKQHSAPGGRPYNEECLLKILQAVKNAGLAGKVDVDIEFAGGEGPGRRRNPVGYEWTLKETVTPSVLAYAHKNGINLKYRETIQGGDGTILLGTEQSTAKVMATQLDHLSKYNVQDPWDVLDKTYYRKYADAIQENGRTARDAYNKFYYDPDFALLQELNKGMGVKGGSRKLMRDTYANPYEPINLNVLPAPLLAGFRAIGFNAASISTGVHLTPIYGQGTAFYESLDRTEKILQSSLVRERLMTAFWVRDLHVMDELKGFIELYNPEYWKKFDQFDNQGNPTIEAKIAKRVAKLVYKDDPNRRVYARLMYAVGKIEDDLNKFDQIRERYDFDDIEATLAAGDYGGLSYQEHVAQKRALIKEIHKNRLNLLHEGFVKREEMALHSTHYSRDNRRYAIQAGAVNDAGIVSEIFDSALSHNEKKFAQHQEEIKAHFVPLLDLHGNA